MNVRTRGRTSQHSIRCEDIAWEKARRRAELEGYAISTVMAIFAKGYGEGLVNMPSVVFEPVAEEVA